MHIDQLIFILLIALAGLFKLLTSKASDAAKKKTNLPPESTSVPRTTQPVTRRPVDTDEERIRRFLEALGQPTSSSPPAPVAPKPTYQKPILLPRTPPLASPLPPLKTRPPDLPKSAPPIRPREVITAKPPPIPTASVEPPTFEVHADTAQMSAEPSEASIDFTNLLGSTAALRNAVILREIFGPPRGLQQFDLIGN